MIANGCWIAINSKRWLGEAGQLSGVLDALESLSTLTPERFGPDERHLKPYARKSVLSKAPKTRGREWFLMLVRTTSPEYDASLASVDGTKIQIGFKSSGAADWKPAFDLGDELARRVEPQLLAVAPRFERRDPAEGEDAETIDWIIESGDMYEPLLRQYGLIGLAPRTYLSPEIVELIGRARIDKLDLPRRDFENGGIRVDLVEDPWRAPVEDMVKPWRVAMAVLRPSEVFSTGKVTSPTGTVLARRGKRWV